VDGFQESLEFVNQPKNRTLWYTLTCHQGFVPGALPFALREISNEMSLGRSITW